MPNNLDMGGFGSLGLPVFGNLRNDLTLDSQIAAGSALEMRTGGALKARFDKAGSLACASITSLTYTVFSIAGAHTLYLWSGGYPSFVIDSNGMCGLKSGGIIGWTSNASTGAGTQDLSLRRGGAGILRQVNGANAQENQLFRSYTDESNYSRLTNRWNTSTAVIHAEGTGTGSDGSVAFNDAALATNATVGFLMIPSCAGTPSGTPADIPTGQIPLVLDSTNLKLYAYTGGAWKASAAFT